MKLFEIPVYALTKEKLSVRVEEERQRIKNSFRQNSAATEEFKQFCMGQFVYPECLWEYNHIVGYIVIRKEKRDMILEWYAELPRTTRYRWKSSKKKFLQNMQLNGYHFYIGNIKTGEELSDRLHDLVYGFSEELKKKRYYADLDAFDNLTPFVDYSKLLLE